MENTKVQVLVRWLKCCCCSPVCYCSLWFCHRLKKRASKGSYKLYTPSTFSPWRYYIFIPFANCPLLQTDHWLIVWRSHQSQMQFPIPSIQYMSLRIAVFIQFDWRKRVYQYHQVHSVSLLLIYTAMLLQYSVTESLILWWNFFRFQFLAAGLIATVGIVPTGWKGKRAIFWSTSPSVSAIKRNSCSSCKL